MSGGRPKGSKDSGYVRQKRRLPTDAEKKRKDERAAATRAITKAKKDADKRDALEKEKVKKAMEAEKRRSNFFKPWGLIGNYPQNTTQPVLPKKRGADKKGKGTRKTRCLTCVKHIGKNGRWIHLCCGSTARGKCEYFDNAGNRIKPEHEPPAPRGNNKKKQKR